MKRILSILLILAIMISVTACAGAKHKAVNGTFQNIYNGNYLELNSDNSYTRVFIYGPRYEIESGTYQLSDDNVIVMYDCEGQIVNHEGDRVGGIAYDSSLDTVYYPYPDSDFCWNKLDYKLSTIFSELKH